MKKYISLFFYINEMQTYGIKKLREKIMILFVNTSLQNVIIIIQNQVWTK